MAKIIKCDTCGSFVLPLVKGDGESCDSHMILMEAQTEGDKAAKHKPVVEIDGDNVTVKIGEIQHPADEDHFIQFVIVEAGSELFIKCFKPGETPEATFTIGSDKINEGIVAYELCNLHGRWLDRKSVV